MEQLRIKVDEIKDKNSTQDMRLTLLEKIVKEHEEDIKELKKMSKAVVTLKNWVIGGVVMFAIQQLGVLEAVKLALKIGV